MRLEIKINWEKQTNKQQQQQQQKQNQAKQKTKNKKQKIVTTEKVIPSQPQPIFPKDLSQVVYLFLSQKSVY